MLVAKCFNTLCFQYLVDDNQISITMHHCYFNDRFWNMKHTHIYRDLFVPMNNDVFLKSFSTAKVHICYYNVYF